jgi:hypothetical protein
VVRKSRKWQAAGITMVAIAAIISLAGCAVATTGSPAVSAEPSGSFAPARVSYATACLDLINHVTAGADLVHEFINDPQRLANGGAATTARFDAIIGKFEYYSSVGPTPLVPPIEGQIKEMRYLRDYLHVGGERNNDFREYKSTGHEIINQCLAAVTTTTTPLPPAAIPAAQPEPTGPVTSFGAGTYVVRTDIVPGTYRSAGPAGGLFCNWARLKDTSGEFAAIITNGNSGGPTTVTISNSDGAFETSGCNTWHKVS